MSRDWRQQYSSWAENSIDTASDGPEAAAPLDDRALVFGPAFPPFFPPPEDGEGGRVPDGIIPSIGSNRNIRYRGLRLDTANLKRTSYLPVLTNVICAPSIKGKKSQRGTILKTHTFRATNLLCLALRQLYDPKVEFRLVDLSNQHPQGTHITQRTRHATAKKDQDGSVCTAQHISTVHMPKKTNRNIHTVRLCGNSKGE